MASQLFSLTASQFIYMFFKLKQQLNNMLKMDFENIYNKNDK